MTRGYRTVPGSGERSPSTDLSVEPDRECVPLMVTENAAAFPDVLQRSGRVHAPRRIGCLHVDQGTRERHPTDSALRFARLMRDNRLP
jgi:hypothetical protein